MKNSIIFLSIIACGIGSSVYSQQTDTTHSKHYKNVIRYNISGAILFGFDKSVVFGYERVIGKRQSISVNFGGVSFPKLISLKTDSLSVTKDLKNTGKNFSIDWRFYLGNENRYSPPHGVYIGPFYSFNSFKRSNEFTFDRASGNSEFAITNTKFDIHTIGAELGYQFLLWKRIALDMVLIGPGMSSYKITSKYDGNLNEEDQKKLQEAIQQIITQKFPGMNYVLADKEFNANGILSTWSVGFRYLIHVGFAF
jgi:hypothetical protein